jgi:adenylylsulfate kinase
MLVMGLTDWLHEKTGTNEDTVRRSIVKAVTYRVIIICLDLCFVYLLTGSLSIAFWFMVGSNAYTTVAYFIHERVWAKVSWGKDKKNKSRKPRKK